MRLEPLYRVGFSYAGGWSANLAGPDSFEGRFFFLAEGRSIMRDVAADAGELALSPRLGGYVPLVASLRRLPRVCTVKRKELDHIRLHRLHPLVTGDADTVITILDEVRVPHLV
jgi:hypothetical protein